MYECVCECVCCVQADDQRDSKTFQKCQYECLWSKPKETCKKKKKTPQKRESQATIYLPKVREFNMPQKYFNHKINIVLDFFRGDGSFD